MAFGDVVEGVKNFLKPAGGAMASTARMAGDVVGGAAGAAASVGKTLARPIGWAGGKAGTAGTGWWFKTTQLIRDLTSRDNIKGRLAFPVLVIGVFAVGIALCQSAWSSLRHGRERKHSAAEAQAYMERIQSAEARTAAAEAELRQGYGMRATYDNPRATRQDWAETRGSRGQGAVQQGR